MRYLGLAAWLANVVLVLASWFCSVPIWLYAVLFVWIFIAFLSLAAQKCSLGDLLGNTPPLLRLLAWVSAGYTGINSLISSYLLRNGGPRINEGVYCLWDHGFIREITKAEYDALILIENRLFFGHTLLFTGLMMAALYGAYYRKQKPQHIES